MTYSKYFSPQETKIPIPITVGVLVLVIVVLAKIFSTSPPTQSKASQKKINMLTLVNPSPNQAGLFWQSEKKEKGWVIYGKSQSNLDQIALDERDLQDKREAYLNHFAVLNTLMPGTVYFYEVISDNQLITDNNGKPFSFTTPTDLESISSINPAYGKVIQSNGDGLYNAITLLTMDNAYPLLALTKTTGEWLITLNSVLDKTTLKVKTPSPSDEIKLTVYGEDGVNSQIRATISHLSPLPQTIIIGQNYDFTAKENVLSATTEKTEAVNSSIDILFPKENSSIPGGRPLVKGTGISGSDITIILDSLKSSPFITKVDEKGTWEIKLAQSLLPGDHQLTLKTKDEKGKNIQLVRIFTIIKSGEQVLGQATSEATPTLSLPTSTPPPSITAFSTPTASPTASLLSLTPTPPTSGSDVAPIALGSASLVIVGLGILLAF